MPPNTPSTNTDPQQPKGQLTTAQEATKFGATGTYFLNGLIVAEDYNQKLQGLPGLKVFDQMRRSDPTIKQALWAVKLPIISSMWTVEPGSDDPRDVEAAEFIESQTLEGPMDWTSFMREALTHLDFGFWVGENLYQYTNWNGKQLIGLQSVESRKQMTVYRWTMKDGKTPGITQLVIGDEYEIPRQKLTVITHDQEGANFAGISILRAAYKPWYFKDKLEKIDTIAHERQGLGIPHLMPPPNASPEDKAKARDVAQNMRANEKGFVEVPEGWTLEFMDMHANTTKDATNSISYYNRQILSNVLAQFLDLGSQGSSGSYNLSVDQSRLFLQNLEAIAKNMAEAFNRDIVKPLIDVNGFAITDYPKITFNKIGDEQVQILADALGRLAAFGMVTPDRDLENYVRESMRLPKLPQEIYDNYDERILAKPGFVQDVEQFDYTPTGQVRVSDKTPTVPTANDQEPIGPGDTPPGDKPATAATRGQIAARQVSDAVKARRKIDRSLDDLYGRRRPRKAR